MLARTNKLLCLHIMHAGRHAPTEKRETPMETNPYVIKLAHISINIIVRISSKIAFYLAYYEPAWSERCSQFS